MVHAHMITSAHWASGINVGTIFPLPFDHPIVSGCLINGMLHVPVSTPLTGNALFECAIVAHYL